MHRLQAGLRNAEHGVEDDAQVPVPDGVNVELVRIASMYQFRLVCTVTRPDALVASGDADRTSASGC